MVTVKPLAIVTASFAGVGLLLAIVGVATDSWTVPTEYSVDSRAAIQITNTGLWRVCVSSACVSWDTSDSRYWFVPIAQGLAVTGVVLAGLAAVLHVAAALTESRTSKSCTGGALALSLIGGLLLTGSWAVFLVGSFSISVTSATSSSTSDLAFQMPFPGYSMYLVIVAGVFFFVTWIMSCALCCCSSTPVAPQVIMVTNTNQEMPMMQTQGTPTGYPQSMVPGST